MTDRPQTRQFAIRDVLKLMLVVAACCVACPPTLGWPRTVIAVSCVLGMSVADHFATSRRSEFAALFLIPVAAVGFTTVAFASASGGLDLSALALSLVVSVLAAIPGVALSLVALSVVSAGVHRVTGMRFLKYDWAKQQYGS